MRPRCRRLEELPAMSMVCPQCQQVSEQQLLCAGCGCRMVFQTPDPLADSAPDRDGSQWQHSPWGKILIGVLLAQGLSYGLEQLITAGLRARADDEASLNVWGTLLGLV